MFSEPVVYVDIETSGGSISNSRITEIAAIRVEQGEIVKEFQSLVNPGVPLPYWITKLTGISDDDVADAPDFSEIASELYDVLQGALFIAHNVRFDYGFIKHELELCGYNFDPKLLCTVRLSRALYPGEKGHSLEKIISRHNIVVSDRHRAFDDTRAMMEFVGLAYADKGKANFELAIARQLKTKTLPSRLAAGQMDSLKNTPGVYIFEDEEGSPVYVGKSKQVRNRVLSHFRNDINDNKEMRIAQTTSNVRSIETGSELEALLLESKLVKELMPLQNRKLRRTSSNYVITRSTNEQGYVELSVQQKDVAEITSLSDVYGIYTSKAKAKASLEERRQTFSLCPKLLGLEKTKGACFQYQLGRCKGACKGIENVVTYNLRVELASQRSKMESWKYDHPVVLSAEDGTNVVVDKWIVLGYIDPYDGTFTAVERLFNLDSYRILVSFIKRNVHTMKISPFTSSGLTS
jgi:DNA polymerase III subunit epsilon